MSKAWMVTEPSEGRSEILYGTRNEARSAGASEFGCDYIEVRIKRADEWDNTTPTAKAKLDAGWWMECVCCGMSQTREDKPVVDEELVRCVNCQPGDGGES